MFHKQAELVNAYGIFNLEDPNGLQSYSNIIDDSQNIAWDCTILVIGPMGQWKWWKRRVLIQLRKADVEIYTIILPVYRMVFCQL